MRTQFGALAFAMVAGITVLSHAAVAAEIKIMCPAPMRTAIVDLAARFERKTPHKIKFIHLPSSFIVDRVKGGEAVDVTILTARASDDLIKEGKLARRVDIARSSIGIAVRAGAPKPDVSSAEAFKQTLLAVKSFVRNEGAESGIHMLRVFDRLGITEQMQAKTKAMPVNTGYVAELVVRGEAEMAAQQMSELIAVPGAQGYAPATRIPAYHRVLGRRVGGINGAGRRKRIAEFPDVAGGGRGAYSEGTKPRVEAKRVTFGEQCHSCGDCRAIAGPLSCP